MVEVIITISIIGIITSTVVPSISFFKKYKDKLEHEKHLIILENTIKQEIMNETHTNIREYPILADNSNGGKGVCDIDGNQIYRFCSFLLERTMLFKYSKMYESYTFDAVKTEYSSFDSSLIINFKDGKKFIFRFDIIDNWYNYKDTAYLRELEYYYTEGVYETIYFTY